ncbi:WD40/YVTN repeat-like-containing domain superfamily [Sesbania bispinosa]|nr:WD40/YVTN repeat-like-containing domain superfamily [Sesbania bispinosa]
MYLYSLTLQRPTGIVCAINGNFSGGKVQESSSPEARFSISFAPMTTVGSKPFSPSKFSAAIRSLAQFRLTGAQKDYIVVGSDSGRIVILDYNKEKNVFDKIHQETFGKSGCRRIVPGQYLAIDPKGRAVMIGACEKQKLVYVLNRDTAARLTISSPLEAHKSHTLVYSICGVDCGFENPIFAAIELDYSEADQDSTGMAASEAQKHLTFYELDLGLNHVSRKWSDQVDNGANLLVTVPGGADGPSGVLVCAENFVIYKNQGQQDVRAVIPRRADLPAERGVLIVSAAMHKLKSSSSSFCRLSMEIYLRSHWSMMVTGSPN